MVFEKSEIKYIFWATGFALVWFLLLLPNFIKGFDGGPLIQFLFFNLGLTIVLIFVLKSAASGKSIPLKEALGMLCIFIALDCLVPPYSVSASGGLASTITSGPTLIQSSSDYFIGYFGQGFGIHGTFLFIFTYVIMPFLLFLLGASLVKDFVKSI